jgi:hypothetical protein
MTPQFNLKELGVIHMVMDMAIENAEEIDAPPHIVATFQSIIEKVQPLIDEECKIFNEFQELTTQLEDVELASRIVIKNPDAVTTEYNN